MNKERSDTSTNLSHWRDIVGIASGISVILGVAIALTNLIRFVEDSKRANVTLRLSALGQVKEFLKADEDIRRRAQAFLANRLVALLPVRDEKVRTAGSGEAFYLSEEMQDFAAVHYHYEQMGALVKLGYVEFPLIFEIVAFPDAYMDAVEPLRETIARSWKGPNRELPDLGSNIEYLKHCYEKSRKEPTKTPSCS